MKYYNRIRDLREDKDLKQEDIAKILHITQTTYAKIENNKTTLSIDKLEILCYFYNVSADYILGFTNELKELPKK